MNINEKKVVVDYLIEKISTNNCFYIINASGLSVPDVDKLRRNCFSANVSYKVAKNSLINRALTQVFAEKNIKAFESVEQSSLHGFSGILFAGDAFSVPARIIEQFRKDVNNEKPLLKCAFVDGELFFGNEKVKELSSLKSKNELLGDIISLLQSPLKNVVSSLESEKNKLVGILKTLAEK
jgi:large subunit ribosomal protein L10